MISREIERLSQLTGKNVIDTFNDFIDYALWVFGVPVQGWPYKAEVSREFYTSFAELIKEYRHGIDTRGWCDPLGDCFMSLMSGAASSRGQFFTPADVCDLMADITLEQGKDRPKTLCGVYGRRQVMGDPTAGSARNLLALKARYDKEPEAEQPYFIAEDLEPLCVKMSAINMCVHGCYGEAVCHDTLSEPGTVRFGYMINIGLRFGQPPSINYSDEPMMFECIARQPVPVTKAEAVAKPVTKPAAKPATKPVEGSLF